MARYFINTKSPFWWIALSLCLHLAFLAWCPSPTLISSPYPIYLVVDLFSGPAMSGAGAGLDNEPAGDGKEKEQQPTPQTTPKPQPKNHPNPTMPVRPTKATKQKATSSNPDTIRNPAEPPSTPTKSVTATTPLLAVPTETPTASQDHLTGALEISNASGIGNGQPPNNKTGGKTGAGQGSGSESGRGGQAGAGSPVETPFAYGTNPPPPYPSTARRRGWEGEVLLLVEVSAKGEVRKITVKSSSGYRILDRAARNAIYRWKFQAAQRNGRAVAGKVMVPIRFSIKDAR